MACKEYWNNGTTLWVTSKDMKYDRISDSLMKISDSALEDMQLYSPGTLLMVTRSGILKRTLPLAILDRYATVNQDIKTISVLNPCLPEYVFYAIRSNELKILKEYHKDGTTVDSINFDKFISLDLPLPPLGEQKRIINEIEKWMRAVESIESSHFVLNETILTTKSRILSLAISGKLVPQDPTDEPAIDLLRRINPDFAPCDNSHYPVELPSGWTAMPLGHICDTINGLWKGKKEPFVSIGVIRNANFTKDFKLDYSNIEYLDVEASSFAKRALKNGDLIVEKSGGSEKNPVGRAILYEGESGKYSFSNFTMALRIKDCRIMNSHFLYYAIMAYYLRGDMSKMQTQTTGLHNLIGDKYLSMLIPLPPIEEQMRIVKKIELLFTSLNEIKATLC